MNAIYQMNAIACLNCGVAQPIEPSRSSPPLGNMTDGV